ncbi:MAG: hypothetical protein AAB803_00775, partial [Patescibacteria group bacterium]
SHTPLIVSVSVVIERYYTKDRQFCPFWQFFCLASFAFSDEFCYASAIGKLPNGCCRAVGGHRGSSVYPASNSGPKITSPSSPR